jgi:membrane carboxypeptidase/penicillin-binding protein PbpC
VRTHRRRPLGALADAWHTGHRVLDRDGRLLRELTSDLGSAASRSSSTAIGPRLIQATLTSEDAAFYDHHGVDRAAIARAMSQNIRHGRMVSGASTITQQLVKLLDSRGRPAARSITGKLSEAARAQNLEDVAEQDEILREYLNRLPYGHGLVGPEAAARAYFGVASKDLSWAQAAFLAVLPRAPSYLDPYTTSIAWSSASAPCSTQAPRQQHLTDARAPPRDRRADPPPPARPTRSSPPTSSNTLRRGPPVLGDSHAHHPRRRPPARPRGPGPHAPRHASPSAGRATPP